LKPDGRRFASQTSSPTLVFVGKALNARLTRRPLMLASFKQSQTLIASAIASGERAANVLFEAASMPSIVEISQEVAAFFASLSLSQLRVGRKQHAVATKVFNVARIWVRKAMAPGGITGVISALAVIVATDLLLLLMRYLQVLPPVSLTFMIAIVVVALRWGALSSVVTTVGGTLSLTYTFYSPFYTNSADSRSPVLGIFFFLVVSLVLGYLAAETRRGEERALKRENEIRDLYTFSQRISLAQSPAGIFEAMQRHLETLVGRSVLLFDSLRTLEAKSERLGDVEIPKAVIEVVGKMPAVGGAASGDVVVDDDRGNAWLVRLVSASTLEFGVIAVDLGHRSEPFDDMRARVVALIGDAGSSLERLGLARTISEARTREETEQFREALIGSISHELRTPLSSILGASSVLSLAREITGNARLKELATQIHQDSERLNVDIQNILDASRISSNGLHAKLEWVEPADFINAALYRYRNRLAGRAVEITLPGELVLLRLDPALMERALGQILDNAAKYSPPDSAINVSGCHKAGQFVIAVADQGAGIHADDRALLGQKFFRGTRHSDSGLGLGFWIATALVAANGGTIEAASEGVDKGTTITVRLPVKESTVIRSVQPRI
jgi:two-component system, OmpR family, sensor histidine kinase KdpD